jgi:hypothetical protein
MNLRRLRHITPGYLRLRTWEAIFTLLLEFQLRRTTENGKFRFSSKDQIIGREIFLQGGFQEETIRNGIALATCLGYISAHNAGYMIDIGANIGTVCNSFG